MKNIILPILLCVLFSLQASAQSNYHPGYIIKANGDTIKGYIDYKEWNQSPKFVNFKYVLSDKQTVYNAPVLKGFQVTGLDDYISYTGPVSTSKTSMTDLSFELDTGKRPDSVFLKVLSKGPNVSLLYHVDNIKRRYFIMETGKQPIELKYYVYLNSRNFIVEVFDFRDQLNILMQKYAPGSNLTTNLKQATYTNELVKYIHIINGNTYESETTSNSATRFFLGAGAAYNITNFSGPLKFNFQDKASSIAPVVTIGLDILPNKNVQKYFTRLELSFTNKSATFTGTSGYYSLQQYSIILSPQYFLNLYNKDDFKLFVGAGIGIGFNSTPNSKLVATDSGIIINQQTVQTKGESYISLKQGDYIKDPYPISTISANLNLKAGLIINKSFEIYLSGIPVNFFEAKDANYSYNSSRIALGFNYFLSRSK